MSLTIKCSAVASWGPRFDTVQMLAINTEEALRKIDVLLPTKRQWFMSRRTRPFSSEMVDFDSLVDAFERRVARADDGSPEPLYGYYWSAYNSPGPTRGQRDFRIGVTAGCNLAHIHNVANLTTEEDPDPTCITFEIFRGAVVALAEPFQASIAYAYPRGLTDYWRRGQGSPVLPLAWISYVAPRFAHLVVCPTSAIVESRPDGGLLMAATDESFSVENARHMAVARDIEAALAPFHALPWPPEAHVG